MEAHVAGVSLLHAGRNDPELWSPAALDLVRAVKAGALRRACARVFPGMETSPTQESGPSIREWLIGLREAGLDTILVPPRKTDDEVRWCRPALPTSLDEIAYEVGLRSSSTRCMYAAVDSPRTVAHL